MGSSGSWYSLVLSILLVSIQGNVLANGSQNKFYPHAPPMKTIQNEYGDQIDCVDFYSQPAFAHPLLRSHKFQMKPSFLPKDLLKDAPSDTNLTAMPKLSLGVNGTCPEGTVPILRGPQDPNIVTKSHRSLPSLQYSTAGHEYAVVSMSGSKYHGSSALLNLWNPLVDANEVGFSLGQLWAVSDINGAINTVEAGWHVFPKFYSGDTRTRLFIYWTSDGYKKTGCYNLKCPGFVQVSTKLAPGAVLPASTYKGSQLYLNFFVYRDPKTAHWWLRVADEWIGYWPRTIFTTLASGATRLEWGGEIINGGTTVHTTTDMGSGHFPSEGLDGVSASFNNLQYVDQNYKVMKPTSVSPIVPRPKCYDLKLFGDVGGNRGYTFFFGGPGRNANCR